MQFELKPWLIKKCNLIGYIVAAMLESTIERVICIKIEVDLNYARISI